MWVEDLTNNHELGNGSAGSSLDASGLFSVQWIGEPTRTYYNSVKYSNQIYNVGDHVYLFQDDDYELPFIAQIQSLFEENGKMMLQAKWYFRPDDTVPRKISKAAHGREVFASEEYDDNPIGAIKGPCYVGNLSHIEDFSAWVQADHHYFYKHSYSSKTAKCIIRDKVISVPIHIDYNGVRNNAREATKKEKEKEKEKGKDKDKEKRIAESTPRRSARISSGRKGEDDELVFKPSTRASRTRIKKEKSDEETAGGSIEFGPVLRIEDGETFYRWFTFQDNKYEPGDHALLRPHDNDETKPYVAKILSIFSDEHGEPTMGVQWYFRFEELAPNVQQLLEKEEQEVFPSMDSDYNPIRAVIGPCKVSRLLDSFELSASPHHYFFKKWYDSFNKKLVDTPPEIIQKIQTRSSHKKKKSKPDKPSPTKAIDSSPIDADKLNNDHIIPGIELPFLVVENAPPSLPPLPSLSPLPLSLQIESPNLVHHSNISSLLNAADEILSTTTTTPTISTSTAKTSTPTTSTSTPTTPTSPQNEQKRKRTKESTIKKSHKKKTGSTTPSNEITEGEGGQNDGDKEKNESEKKPTPTKRKRSTAADRLKEMEQRIKELENRDRKTIELTERERMLKELEEQLAKRLQEGRVSPASKPPYVAMHLDAGGVPFTPAGPINYTKP